MRFVGLVVYNRYCSTTRQYAFVWNCVGLELFDRNIVRQRHEVKALIFGKNPSVTESFDRTLIAKPDKVALSLPKGTCEQLDYGETLEGFRAA